MLSEAQKGRSSSARMPDNRPVAREIPSATRALHDDSHFVDAIRLGFTDAVNRHEEISKFNDFFSAKPHQHINYYLFHPRPIYP